MHNWFEFGENEFPDFIHRLPYFLASENSGMILDSSGNSPDNFSFLGAFGSIRNFDAGVTENNFEKLKSFLSSEHAYYFGHFSYDLKNEIELLSSAHTDGIGFSKMHFFIPEIMIKINGGKILVGTPGKKAGAEKFLSGISNLSIPPSNSAIKNLHARTSKSEYISNAQQLISHIERGDIYEINYCIEFFAENVSIDPAALFIRLNSISEAPFSCLYKNGDQWLICASPERFLQKKGSRIISQPIKGTRPRGKTPEADEELKKELFLDPKERSENVMIVDLVRNDLSKSAKKGSVKVDELFGIYSFKSVHQMVSTVSAELDEQIHPVDAIRNAFPMGSMTGAPKVSAMKLAEEFENMKRGLYSGAVGYFTPELDFDFNVVIRSIQYHSKTGYLSLMVGSALTANANPEKEYEECLLKAKKLFESLGVSWELGVRGSE
jgi:para-aminobenzoate synthetase component 1